MATLNKKKTIKAIVTVKDLLFRTASQGRVFPLYLFNKNKTLEKHSVNAAMFEDLSIIQTIQPGAKIRVHLDENLVPVIKHVIRPAKRITRYLPDNCETCDEALANTFEKREDGTIHQKISCTNAICPAQSKSNMVRLIKCVTFCLECTADHALDFLKYFPDDEKPADILNFKEFKILYGRVKNKNTESRRKAWLKTAGEEKGNDLWQLELEIEKYLFKKQKPALDFWYICNFPNLQKLSELTENFGNVDPSDLFQNHAEAKKRYKALSPTAKKYINVNFSFISFLYKFFESYCKDTKWKL